MSQSCDNHIHPEEISIAFEPQGFTYRASDTDYLYEHLDQAIEPEELADLLGLRRFDFSTAFRLAAGMTLCQVLQHPRMAKAKHLLAKKPGMPSVAIGLAVGYRAASTFAPALRKIVGTPPTDFRRRALDVEREDRETEATCRSAL